MFAFLHQSHFAVQVKRLNLSILFPRAFPSFIPEGEYPASSMTSSTGRQQWNSTGKNCTLHSSLYQPPLSALTADSTESTHTSIKKPSAILREGDRVDGQTDRQRQWFTANLSANTIHYLLANLTQVQLPRQLPVRCTFNPLGLDSYNVVLVTTSVNRCFPEYWICFTGSGGWTELHALSNAIAQTQVDRPCGRFWTTKQVSTISMSGLFRTKNIK